MKTVLKIIIAIVFLSCTTIQSSAQHKPADHQQIAHQHGHGEKSDTPVVRPKVYLDKSPRVVAYQLKRLDNERLLLVERNTSDPKFAPVYAAIVVRPGMSRQAREESVGALATINQTDNIAEYLAAIGSLVAGEKVEQQVAKQLAMMLLKLPAEKLSAKKTALQSATQSENNIARSVGYAGLIGANDAESAWNSAKKDANATVDFLNSVSLVPNAKSRAALRETVVALLADSQPEDVRQAAIRATAFIPVNQTENFQLLSPFIAEKKFKTAAVRSMLAIPGKLRDLDTAAIAVKTLVDQAEKTEASQRTNDDFIDSMQLVDQLLAKLPTDQVKAYRTRLREITVRMVVIHTVEEEMRYDIPWFAVEAGLPVQVILKNEDLMPHNLVISKPDTLREIAAAGVAAGPDAPSGKAYVPQSPDLLFATNMVPAEKTERLTFTAPKEPGEYPFVCTFPGHWMRMYGVMVVVENLDAWLKDPVEPKDPTGIERAIVQNWKLEDFGDNLANSLRGRSNEIGKQIFVEASCAQCHKMHGEGGAVGPDLSDVMTRWKGDLKGIMREIIEPSHKVDPKFAIHTIDTVDGLSISGVVTAEDKESISIVSDPLNPKPRQIAKVDIEEMFKSSNSIMPKALLDRFTKDEVLEMLNYITAPKK